MEDPGAGGTRAPEISLAASKIDPEYASPLLKLQAGRLTRRCAISFAMAAVVAPILHGEG